jgi:5'-3' exonuclease
MGVEKLLADLYPATDSLPDDLSELKDCRGGIDIFIWIHRTLIVPEAYRQFHTHPPVPVTEVERAMRKLIAKLSKAGIVPVFVFDVAHHPMKEAKGRRDTQRAEKEQKLNELWAERRAQDFGDVQRLMKDTTYVRSDIVATVIKIAKELGVEFYSAPFEADWQLVSMEREGLIDFILSTDSDYIALGAQCVCYRLTMKSDKRIMQINI